MNILRTLSLCGVALVCALAHGQKQWTLSECVAYAMDNNIELRTSRLSTLSALEDVKEANAKLLPTLAFSTSHQLGYSPFADSKAGSDKGSYSGDYGVNGSWTVWDGKKIRNNVKLQRLVSEQSELTTKERENSIQEQIVQLYVQILYVKEAVKVNAEVLRISEQNADRGREMYNVGSISKADLSQLEAQRASDEYNLVNIEGTLEDYKLQMKSLLQLAYDAEFDVVDEAATDAAALTTVPTTASVLEAALALRPEIRNADLAVESGSLDISIAKAGSGPTVSLSAGVGTNTMSGMGMAWTEQMKDNVSGTVGATLSIPLLDNRSTKTAVNKAKLSLEQAKLEALDARRDLELTVQGYWISATTNQQRFRSAVASVASAEDSYELLCEQVRLGLKNIVELTSGKSTLLNAQQSKLESKYMTILYLQLMEFYKTGTMGATLL